jgi:hypothetical protein
MNWGTGRSAPKELPLEAWSAPAEEAACSKHARSSRDRLIVRRLQCRGRREIGECDGRWQRQRKSGRAIGNRRCDILRRRDQSALSTDAAVRRRKRLQIRARAFDRHKFVEANSWIAAPVIESPSSQTRFNLGFDPLVGYFL